jgi:hypothetical protein
MYTKDACKGFTIPEKALKKIILDMIRQYEPFLEQAFQPMANTVTNDTANTKESLKEKLTAAQFDFDRNSRFLKGLYESLVQGDISDSEYKDMKGDYETKIAALAVQIKYLRESVHIHAQQEKAFLQAHKSVQTIEQISDLTADIIDKLVERIIVHQDGRLDVKFRFLDDIVFGYQESDAVNAKGGALA